MTYSTALNESVASSSDEYLQDVCFNEFSCLSDELFLLDLKILRHLEVEERFGNADENTAGFFVTEEEVRASLKTDIKSREHLSSPKQEDTLNNKIKELEANLLEKGSSRETLTVFPLQMISEKISLDRFEIDVLVMALALEIDKKYERIFAYFNDDLNKKAPSIDLALSALGTYGEKTLSVHKYFSEQAPLRAYNLIYFVNNHDEEGFLSTRFRVDEGIKNFIFGVDIIHPLLRRMVKYDYPLTVNQLSGSKAKAKNEIRKILADSYSREPSGLIFWLYGKSGAEKKSVVTALCCELEIPLFTVNIESILSDSDVAETIKLLFRDAVLNSATLFLQGGNLFSQDDERIRSLKRLFFRAITDFTWFVFIDARNFWAPENHDSFLYWCPIEVKTPTFFERRHVWADLLQQTAVDPAHIDAVAGRFAFNEDQIAKAVDYLNLKYNNSTINLDTLIQACSFQSPENLPSFTKKVTLHYKWDDLVLSKDKLQHLKEICGYLKYKHQVYFDWGFDKKLSLGKGLNILFTGPSGTGKTMTAEILADELKLDLYKTDLSSIVSKYIGETEKNLEKIFDATSAGNAILFFDEADALFGKRSEVKDAHDRYANIETNYLLQRIEEHNGVVILSTNLGKNMDDAFLRRMQFTVEFPFPDEKHRELIWQKMYPADTPVSGEINYRFLSKKLNISGGNIKNIALASAFLAAERDKCVEMKHILFAARREYEKLGKAFVKSDFVPYEETFEEWSI